MEVVLCVWCRVNGQACGGGGVWCRVNGQACGGCGVCVV